MAVQTGLLPDRYTGPQPIGQGGMGEIFRATDTSLGRAVAVKVLAKRYALDEAVRERFTREALAAARLSGNPNIVTIFDVGEHGGRPFIVMEYLAGGSLEERLRADGAEPPALALAWLEQAASALDAAHREGVVHRDVKPANLLLDRGGTVHVADFGIASAAGLGSLTQTGTVLGTASYLSPEQAKGERTTPASDRYSLGVVAFELLTGRRPFEGDSVAAEAAQHVTAEIPSVCDVNPETPCELDPVFERALAKDPADRFGSCAEFVAALRHALADAAGTTQIVAPRRPAVVAPPTAYRRRRPAWLLPLLGLLALLAIGGGIAATTMGGGKTPAAAPPVSVKTITQQGTTVQQTVTVAAPPPPTTAASTSAPSTTTSTTTPTTVAAPAGSSGDALNAQAYALMQRGDYAGALPLLQQAVQALQGQTGDISNGYANYNLGVTLMRLGRCADALPYLETAKQLEPARHEVKDALKLAKKC
ncbi:MAG: eukaryotic-like serine/threonine-protein kinase [Gaiellaceae bacterium]|nr:eukaryotic-like serine/threonine-protein kinase [Gaiellaceae bacterium]